MTDTQRKFDMTLEIDAPVEDVWRALTDAVELERWFPLSARVKPGKDGSIFLSWGPGCEGEAPITIWEPGRRLQWTESLTPPGSGENSAPVPVAVDFHLESRGGRTVLRLVHSGFHNDAAWDGYYDSISRGWKFELRGLRHYLEHHRGTPRRVVWARHRSELPPAQAAERVLGADSRVLRGALDGLVEGDRYRLGFADGDTALEGVVRVNALPRSFAATAENWNDAYFRFEIENMGGGPEAWLWLSTYDLDPAEATRLEQRWNAELARALARPA